MHDRVKSTSSRRFVVGALIGLPALCEFALAQTPCAQPTLPGYDITVYASVVDPIQLAFAGDGTLYVGRDNSGSGGTNTDSVKIHKILPGGGLSTEFGEFVPDPDAVMIAPTTTTKWNAGDVLVGGQVMITPQIEGQVVAFTPAGGAPTNVLDHSTTYADPHHFAFGSTGRLVFADRIGKQIFAYTPGLPLALLIPPLSAQPTYIALDAADHIYVSDDAGVIDEYDSQGTFVRNITNVSLANAPAPIAISNGGPWGNALYTLASGRVVRVKLATLERTELGCGFNNRTLDLCFGPDGALYMSRFDDDQVLRVEAPSCTSLTPTVPGFSVSTYASVDGPVQLSFASDGSLYVGRDIQGTGGAINTTPTSIYKIAPGGSPAGAFGQTISDPDAVTVARTTTSKWSAGDVLVGGQAVIAPPIQGQIVALDAMTAALSTVFGLSASYSDPHCFAWDSSGRLLIADRLGAQVLWSVGAPSEPPHFLFSLPNKVQFIAVDDADHIYSSDSEGFLYKDSVAGAATLFAGRLDKLAPIAVSPGGVWGTGLYTVSDSLLLRYDSSANANVVGCGFTNGTSFIEFGPDGALYVSRIDDDVVLRIAPLTASYCTGGTTTNGCVAVMTSSGAPSATATSGFTLAITNVEGQKQGILFYGITGAAAAPWGSGTSYLCVKSPTQRTGAQNAGGTPNACDGTLSLDVLAYLAATPGALGNPFSVGQHAWFQGWFRDPPAVKTTSLSDGLEVTFAP